MIRQGKKISVHQRINMVQHGDVALRVLPLKVGFGIFHASFEWGEHGRFFSALQRAVSVHHAARDRGMSPDGDVVCSIKGIAAGMIEVIVRIERSFYRHLTQATENIHLERSSLGADKALNEKCAVFTGKKAAIAHGLQAFGGIGNCGVETVADSSDRREALVSDYSLG